MNITEKTLRKLVNEELSRPRRGKTSRLDEMMGMGRLADENEFQSDFESSWDTSDEEGQPSQEGYDAPEFIDLSDDELGVLSTIAEEGYGSALVTYGDEANMHVQTLVDVGFLRHDEQTGSYFVTPAGRQYITDDVGRY